MQRGKVCGAAAPQPSPRSAAEELEPGLGGRAIVRDIR